MTTIQTAPPPVRKINPAASALPAWTGAERTAFRFFFLYFAGQAVPLDPKFYAALFSVDWADLHFRDIFYLSRYSPQFFPGQTFANWAVVALLAAVGTVGWSILDRRPPAYDGLYYVLRVVLRYRLAAGVLAYGFLMLFPMMAPPPSLSHLNTNYGDFTAWKLFSLSLGIVPAYELFLGGVAVTAGVLLLFRRTTTIATLILIPFLGNVFVSNLAYEGGEAVYSLYLTIIALFLFAYDGLRFFRLLILEKPTLPNRYVPAFRDAWQRNGRLVLKGAFVVGFVGLYGYQAYAGYRDGGYHYPKTPGLAGAAGLYHVREFRVNGKTLPPSQTDPVRWQDVVFEKWATLSIRSNRPVALQAAVTEEIYLNDNARDYEQAGSAGRHYYHYRVDTVHGTLHLENRNRHHAGEKLTLHYTRPDAATLVLSGVNERNEALYVVLERRDKKYLLEEVAREGRRKPMKL
jgi:hypothetical protein